MAKDLWQELLLPKQSKEALWELFHENSKLTRFEEVQSDEEIVRRTQELHESLPYHGYPEIKLPEYCSPAHLSLDDAIKKRVSSRNLKPTPLPLDQLALILHYAYGISRPNEDSAVPRSFRTVPSAGALYPLELFIHTAHVSELEPGLYHYHPPRNSLRLLRSGNQSGTIAASLIQPDLALNASVVIFMTAVFERSVFKYGERGYRFILLEAGHVAQNVNLVATALGLASINIGGFRDREVDEYLELDGLNHSTLYMVALGSRNRMSKN